MNPILADCEQQTTGLILMYMPLSSQLNSEENAQAICDAMNPKTRKHCLIENGPGDYVGHCDGDDDDDDDEGDDDDGGG